MKQIGIFYGSSSGNTESVAKQLQQTLGADRAQLHDVANAKSSDLEAYSILFLGSSTWGVGDLQDDFETFMGEISSANLEGKTVALFGCGDQDSYPDSFVDAMGQIYEAIKDKGCKIVGQIPTDGYTYDASQAEEGGQFVGLPLDEDNQDDLTAQRIADWVTQLEPNFA